MRQNRSEMQKFAAECKKWWRNAKIHSGMQSDHGGMQKIAAECNRIAAERKKWRRNAKNQSGMQSDQGGMQKFAAERNRITAERKNPQRNATRSGRNATERDFLHSAALCSLWAGWKTGMGSLRTDCPREISGCAQNTSKSIRTIRNVAPKLTGSLPVSSVSFRRIAGSGQTWSASSLFCAGNRPDVLCCLR